METAYLLPFTIISLVLALAGLGYRADRRRGYGPFILGVVAAIGLLVGKFVVGSDVAVYGAIAALVGASLWNAWPTRSKMSVSSSVVLGQEEIKTMAASIDFAVIGEQKIHCEGCEERIGNALLRLPGVAGIRANHQTQQVAVQFDPAQVQPNQILAKLEQLGYEVRPKEESR